MGYNLMKAVILAADRGSRMNNLTAERPNCLVMPRGKAPLDRQLEPLLAVGISLPRNPRRFNKPQVLFERLKKIVAQSQTSLTLTYKQLSPENEFFKGDYILRTQEF